jgi:hypothetical protein
MNKYKVKFQATCPVNGDSIEYSLQISIDRMIRVEALLEAVNGFGSGFHEEIANVLHKKFGGRQLIIAIHGGVIIETERGV